MPPPPPPQKKETWSEKLIWVLTHSFQIDLKTFLNIFYTLRFIFIKLFKSTEKEEEMPLLFNKNIFSTLRSASVTVILKKWAACLSTVPGSRKEFI